MCTTAISESGLAFACVMSDRPFSPPPCVRSLPLWRRSLGICHVTEMPQRLTDANLEIVPQITAHRPSSRLCTLPDLVLRAGLEVAGVVTLVQLARGIAPGAVDHATALHGRAFGDGVGPALHVLVLVH